MADTTISITIPEAQWSTVQAAFAFTNDDDSAGTVDAAYIKAKLTNVLTARVKSYDDKRQTVTYSTFSPS
tara:strand:- start:50 stop:259 length:210 start_codon:yes stop_codon:yes gene_type:complete